MEIVDDPQKVLSELARLGAGLIIQRAVEEEFDSWLGRARYERRRGGPPGLRNGFRPRTLQIAEGGLRIEIPRVRETAEPFVSKLFRKGPHQAAAAHRSAQGDDCWRVRARPVGA